MTNKADEPPEWMLQLENRQKRQHRLAHDIGAGAPCLKCVDSCPGLGLHFWRKICRNCRCRKEDHQVTDEDSGFLQFEILLCADKSNKKFVRKAVLDLDMPPSDSDKKQAYPKSVVMDWVPPGIPLELAAEYMKKLPTAKLPITGSSGAQYRKQQFEKQLPSHDLSILLCHDLSSNEVEEFNKYLNNIKTNVVGQGKVEKLTISTTQIAQVSNQNLQKPKWSSNLKNSNFPTSKPFDNFPSSQQSQDIDVPLSGSSASKFSLKSPRDFIAANSRLRNVTSNNLSFNNNNIYKGGETTGDNQENVAAVGYNINDKNSGLILARPYNAITDTIGVGTQLARSSPIFGQTLPYHSESLSNSIVSSTGVPGFDAFEKNIPNPDNLRVGGMQITDPKTNVFLEYSDGMVLQRPAYSEHLKEIAGEPSSGLVPNIKESTSGNDSNNLQVIVDQVNQKRSFKCQHCTGLVYEGDIVVTVEKGEMSVYYHPQCFVCTCCQELLVDLVYFFYKNKVYCGRHYAEVVDVPRCFACDELIFVKEYTMAEGKNFHIRHFCCIECDEPLAGKEYIPLDHHPICINCYNRLFAKVCLTCKDIISPTEKRVSIKEMHWHATETCFLCGFCKRSLLQAKMVIDKEKPFCNRNCVLSAQ